nr:hypothetical protein [Bacilli bacterium]
MLNNNLIVIYAKPATYKSSLGVSLLSASNKKTCYIDLEGNKHISIADNIAVYNDITNIDKYLEENDILLVDYIELANYNIEDIKSLKEKAVANNKTIILISCCASGKDIFNENYNNLKEVSDLIITLDK